MDLRLDESTWNNIITNFEKKLEDEIEISVKIMRIDDTKKRSESDDSDEDSEIVNHMNDKIIVSSQEQANRIRNRGDSATTNTFQSELNYLTNPYALPTIPISLVKQPSFTWGDKNWAN